MENIYGYTLSKLEDYFLSIGEKKFKAVQVYEWLYKKRVTSISLMSNVKHDTILKMEDYFVMDRIKIVAKKEGLDVIKYLFELKDGNRVEAVLMKHDYGNSLCVSSEVGCNMGCAFCESGRLKKVRNLTSDEMLLQVLKVEEDIKSRISHVVIMGIGEPFDNYDNVMDFINIINDAYALAIGIRHITVSTSGIVPKIKEFAKEGLGVNLAISLHAPNNEIRNKIMKINKAYDINELIESVKEYLKLTNRRVTFEYIMLKDINDTDECAKELANLLKGINCYVNIIPYNETNNIGFKRSLSSQITRFCGILKENNINVTIRREFGSKVSAACGQLRSKIEEENK